MKDHKLIQSLFKQSFKISFNPATRALVCSVWLWIAACCSSILFSKHLLCFSIDKCHMSQIPFICGSSSWWPLSFPFWGLSWTFFDSPVSFGFGGEFSGVEVLGCESDVAKFAVGEKLLSVSPTTFPAIFVDVLFLGTALDALIVFDLACPIFRVIRCNTSSQL